MIMERFCTLYAKHGKLVKLVDADASGAKASTKHIESRLEVFQGHSFWDHRKADEGMALLYNNVGFRVENFEGKVLASPLSCHSASHV